MLKLEIADILKSYGTLIGIDVRLLPGSIVGVGVGVAVGEGEAVAAGVSAEKFPVSAIAMLKIAIAAITMQTNNNFLISTN
jgi:hypothetical protein